MKFIFDRPLIDGLILSRPNRFIFNVMLNDQIVEAHCPSGGTIAGLSRKDMQNLKCYLSDHGEDTNRRTRYTVEAVSLDDGQSYMGINQTRSNRYVEQFLTDTKVREILSISDRITREKKLRSSRIDFKVDDCYIEVKTMVAEYYCKPSDELAKLMKIREPSIDRMQKHINDLAAEIEECSARAAVITVFQYDAPIFKPPIDREIYHDFVNDLKIAKSKGLKQYQMNIRITKEYVELISFFENETV